MKKLTLLIPALLSLVFALSCGKDNKPTPSGGCPPKTCEFGMDSVTCKCLPDPNDTTGNGGTDTPAVIVSKFGNGSNGTIDTTVSNLLDRGWDRDSVYVSFYRPEMNFRWYGQGIPYYNVDGAYELLKDGKFVKLQSSKPNTLMQNQIGDYMRIGVYSIDETVPSDVYNWGEISFALGVQLGRDDMLASLNEVDMSFNYTTNIDVNCYDGTFNESQMTNPSIRWKLVGRAGTRYTYYLVMKFTYNGSNYEYRTMLKYE